MHSSLVLASLNVHSDRPELLDQVQSFRAITEFQVFTTKIQTNKTWPMNYNS